jgi:7,8-dihydropterin-6-yl-methyl-4-(beta-D-ribofuranosyl)aminobenzene 5'-phosphate synthase
VTIDGIRRDVPLDTCITTLVENSTSRLALQAEHGLSFWIEYGDKHILFDTGQSDLLIRNAETLGVDLTQTDAIVLSHGHYDHTGGLSTVLNMAPKAQLYLHPAALEPKYCRSIPKARSIGMPDSARQAIHNHQVIWTESHTQVFDGMRLTGRVPRVTDFEDVGGPFFLDEDCLEPDPLLDDQALFIESSKGLIVILGCAHAGLVNTLQRISELKRGKKFYAAMGGMHLVNAETERIERTVSALRQHNLQKISPAHCTGDEAVETFRNAFPEQYFDCSVGARIKF